MTVGELTDRLLAEWPEMTATEAVGHAERILAWSQQQAFRLEVERDLDALPLTTREAA